MPATKLKPSKFTSLRDWSLATQAEDRAKAERLRKAAALPAPKVGPKVAR